MKSRILLIAILFFTFVDSYSQEIDLAEWKIETLPIGIVYDTVLHHWYNPANVSNDNWLFRVNGNKVEIIQNSFIKEKGDTFPFNSDFISNNLRMIEGRRFVKKIPDGFLVGLNNGEFGGGIFYVSENGETNYIIGRRLRIKEIFEFNSNIYAIEGIAHLGSNYGQVIEIYKDTLWKSKTAHELIESPILAAKHNEDVIIITSQYILRMTKNNQIEQILKSPFDWGILYPSSLFFEGDDIYLAMRQGVLKIEKFMTAPKYEWYLPR